MTVRAIIAKRAIANRTVHTQNLKHKRKLISEKQVREFYNYDNVDKRVSN